ncbi:hypothetical protein SAMN05421734_102433 [Pelagirhabdus alkalitolerans]|uniref:Uncharacterized protein n=1 Tax=Pelagirhabdus alkalitolerans TaxID=1612202 RepID=A0A1G6HB85_9BACI|nr:hypothetical protein SAMN05421734_102433 [Pelagirhabdus alkalitolerans]
MIYYFSFFDHGYRANRWIVFLLFFNVCFINPIVISESIEVSIAYIVMSMVLLIQLARFKLKVVHLFMINAWLFLYTGLQLIFLVHPIWLFFNRFIMISLILLLLMIVLIKDPSLRMISFMITLFFGELFFQFMRCQSMDYVRLGDHQLFLYAYMSLFMLYQYQQLISRPNKPY